MASPEFNLSVLENATTFSTPLKDCSHYEAILSLIKEEIDIAHTEDEAEYHKWGKRSLMETKRKDSESNDSEGVFKSPYKKNYTRKLKSPGTSLIPRTKRRSFENVKTRVKNYAPQRARSLGRIMPGRSAHSTDRKHRSSVSHSDTSGFSDSVENEKIAHVQNGMTRNIFGNDVKKENETEGKALEDLLTTAREQVIISGQPCDDNSTISSQGESSSLATIDPLASESMEEDYVESSQSIEISDCRRKFLAHRTSVDAKPKTVEMIKKNLHFDVAESDDDNQQFSLTLSPDPKVLVNGNRKSNSTSPNRRNEKESPESAVSAVSTLKNVSQNLRNYDTKKEASVEPSRSTKRSMSQDSETSATSTLKNLSHNLENLTPNSCNSRRQRESSKSPLRSNEIKANEAGAVSPQKNSTQVLDNCDRKGEASSASPRFDEKNTSIDSTTSTLKNSSPILFNSQHQRESSKSPPRSAERTAIPAAAVDAQESSIEKLDLKRETSATPPRPKKRKTKGIKTVSSQESLTEESSNLDAETMESQVTLLEAQQSSIENFELKREASATPPRPKKRKTEGIKSASSQESLTEDSSNLNPEKEGSLTLPRPRKKDTSRERIASSQTNLTEDLEPKNEIFATPPRPKKRKTKGIKTANSQESLTEESSNLDNEKEGSLTPPHPRKRKKREISIDGSLNEVTDNFTTVESKIETNATPLQPKKRKNKKKIISDPLLEITDFDSKGETTDLDSKGETTDLDSKGETTAKPTLPKEKTSSQEIVSNSPKVSIDLSPKKENSPTPSHPKKKKKIQEIISDLLQDVTALDFNAHASARRSRSRKKKANQEIVTSSVANSNELSPKKEASLTPPPPRKKKRNNSEQKQEIVSDPLKDSTDTTCNKETFARPSRSRKKKTNHDIVSTSVAEPTDLSPKREASLTPPRPRKRNSSIGSPLKGLTQEFENCMMNNDFEQICEDIDNGMETPSFTFETVQLLDEYDAGNQHANNKILSKILSSPNSKTDEESPLSIEQIGSSEDPLDYDPLYIAKVEDKNAATVSTSKRKKNTGAKKKEDKRKSNNADKSKIVGRRSSTRLKMKRVTLTVSDLEDDGDLSDEAIKVSKKVEAAKKRESLPPEILVKLDEMVVQLRHDVLPQHEIEQRAGTAPLTYDQQLEFLEFASLNKDTYSSDEDEIIKRNWNAFCEDHDWDPKNAKPFLLFKHGDQLIMSCMEERRKFVQFLADGLPNRPLFSVYSRFKILYSDYADSGTRYSPEEDKKIVAYMLHNSDKEPDARCSALAKVLNRSRVSIWRRYQNLTVKEYRNKKKKKKVLMKVTWELPLVNEFITKLLDVSVSDDLADLKDAFIPKVVWEKLERKIGIDYEFLRRSWDQQFHLQFFSPEPLSLNATKIRLIEYMWMKGIRRSKEIEWHVVVKYFDGCTIPFLRKMFNHLTAQASSVVGSRNLRDILEWLHTIKIDRLRRDPKDKLLPRLCYADKKVAIVPEDFMMLTLTSDNAPDTSNNLSN